MEPLLFFRGLTREDALKLTAIASEKTDAAKVARLFYDDDAWQDGAGWIGPMPPPDDASYADVMDEIERALNSKNVVKEVVENQRDGVLGHEPAWSFVRDEEVTEENPLTDAEAAFVTELNDAATSWWDDRDLTELLRQAHDAAALGERTTLRLYVPRGRLRKNANGSYSVPPGDLDAQFGRLFVELVRGDGAGNLEDKESKTPGALYSQLRDGGGYYLEIAWVENSESDNPSTLLRVIEKGKEGDETQNVYEWDLDGRLPLRELKMNALASPSLLRNQRSINLQKTLQNRNAIVGGFLERLITDAMPPGEYVDDPNNPGQKKYQVRPFRLGAGTTNFLMAAEYGEGQGKRFGSPAVHYRDPVAPSTFIEGKRDSYQDALEESGQTHKLIAGDATASGESRKQARQTFENKLNGVKAQLDPLGRWLLETAAVMALFFAGRRAAWEGFRCNFGCIVNTGPRSADEKREDQEAVKAGTLSQETAMVRDGIEDPGAEKNLIRQEAEESLTLAQSRANVAQTLAASGAGIGAAARVAGFDEKDAARLERSDFVEGDPENAGA